MIYKHSSKTCQTKMNPWTLVTYACFCLASLLLKEIDAAPVSLNTKEYTVKGEILTCLRRDKANACPLDHDIAACETNLTLVTCKPCEIEKGYRLCMQIYSDVDYVKCYKPECTEEEEVVIDVDEYGRCTHADCRCKASEGYVKGDLECVRLKQKCAVNFSVIDGRCRACPDGTHKPTVGFEPCSKLPVSTTLPTEPFTGSAFEVSNSTVNLTGSFTDNERSRSQGATTPDSNLLDEETDPKKTDESGDNTVWIVFIIVAATVVVAVAVVVSCRRYKRGIRCGCRYCCLCPITCNRYHSANIPPDSGTTELSGQRERTGAGLNHGEERPSSPPPYQSSDSMRRTLCISDTYSIGSHGDSNMDTEVKQPFIIPTEPSEQVNPPTVTHLPSWPTLATNGGSSLLQNMRRPATNSSNRGLHDLDNTQEVEGPVDGSADVVAAAAAPPVDNVDDAVIDTANAPTLAIADALAVSDLGAPVPVSIPVPALSPPAPSPVPVLTPFVAPQSSAVGANNSNAPSSVAEGFPEINDSLRGFDFGSNFSNLNEI